MQGKPKEKSLAEARQAEALTFGAVDDSLGVTPPMKKSSTFYSTHNPDAQHR